MQQLFRFDVEEVCALFSRVITWIYT